MSIVTPPAASGFSPFPIRRFTVEEYHRLAEAGVLSEDDRVELLEGWLVPKMIHNPAHDGTIEIADELLRSVLPDGWRIRIQSAITTVDSEPEPDLAVVRGPVGRYLTKRPEAADIAMVIEVADSWVDRDRQKARLYARAGIATYWIVNLPEQHVEVFSAPVEADGEPRYSTQSTYGVAEELSIAIDEEECGRLQVSDLLPNAK